MTPSHTHPQTHGDTHTHTRKNHNDQLCTQSSDLPSGSNCTGFGPFFVWRHVRIMQTRFFLCKLEWSGLVLCLDMVMAVCVCFGKANEPFKRETFFENIFENNWTIGKCGKSAEKVSALSENFFWEMFWICWKKFQTWIMFGYILGNFLRR